MLPWLLQLTMLHFGKITSHIALTALSVKYPGIVHGMAWPCTKNARIGLAFIMSKISTVKENLQAT